MIDDSKIKGHPLLARIPSEKLRVYEGEKSCVFWLTAREYGEFSNMADGFPLTVNGRSFISAEALYQAMKFPRNPEIQKKIHSAKFSKAAKNIAIANNIYIRGDWVAVRTRVMRWVLRIKASQYKKDFLYSLSQTETMPIVEESRKDAYWGAIRIDGYLVGMNVLGRLLMELRDDSREDRFDLFNVPPPEISDLKLFGEDIWSASLKL